MVENLFQISDRFREAVERRISRLEQGAIEDERVIPTLLSEDHRQRQRLLVSTQIEEAVRLRARLSFNAGSAMNATLGLAPVAER